MDSTTGIQCRIKINDNKTNNSGDFREMQNRTHQCYNAQRISALRPTLSDQFTTRRRVDAATVSNSEVDRSIDIVTKYVNENIKKDRTIPNATFEKLKKLRDLLNEVVKNV